MEVNLTVRLPNVSARDGDDVLILCNGFWSKGKTLKEAKARLQWSLSRRGAVYSVHPSTFVDDIGRMVRTAGTPAPLELHRWG